MYVFGFVTAPILYAIYYYLSSRKLLCFGENRQNTDADAGKFVAEEGGHSKAIGLSHKL